MRRAGVRQPSRNSASAPRAGKRKSGKLDPRFVEYRRSRDHDLRNELIEAHRWLAVHCARRFVHKGEPMDDLEQVAVVGLLKAVERFDPGVGAMFSTFAVPTIIGELRRHFRDKTWAVHVPPRRQGELPAHQQRGGRAGSDAGALADRDRAR